MDGNILFEILDKLSQTQPELIEVEIAEDGELEFELDYDFFMAILQDNINGQSKQSGDETSDNGC